MRSLRLVGVLALTETVSFGVLLYPFSVLLLPMERDLGASRGALSAALAAAAVARAIAAPIVGGWVDRRGVRWLMTTGSFAGAGLVWAWSVVSSVTELLVLAIPEWIPLGLVVAAKEHVGGRSRVSELHDAVRVEHLNEGRSVQTLHVGPFDAEAEVLERIHNDILPRNGLTPSGSHHEIYLSDIRRVVPERMRTILRQPVRLLDGVQSWPDLGSLSCPSR